jgi:hypothetical protein
MTTNGHKHKISHPGYGQSKGFNRSNDFVFSDNIDKWIGSKKVNDNRVDKRLKRNK